jgi:pimeloyl-ACP methyl ester carboxylesterase
MAKALINGIQIQYQTIGSGPDLVMVHGLAANLAFWFLRIVPHLSKSFRVTVFDLRGHGGSGMPPSGYTTADLASDLVGLMDHLRIERAHLVGHSFGGAVALHAAALRPERVETLGLADCRVHALQPIPSVDNSEFWEIRRRQLEERGIRVTEDTPKILYAMLEEFGEPVSDRQGTDRGLAFAFGSWNPNSRTGRLWLRLRSTTTIRDDVRSEAGLDRALIRTVRTPTLLIFGEQSRCLKSCRQLEQLLPHHQTTILPGVGHFFPVQVPELFAQRLMEFLAHDAALVPPPMATRIGQPA